MCKVVGLVAAKCTQCNANLEVDPTKEKANCRYCKVDFMVGAAINNTTLNIYETTTTSAEVLLERAAICLQSKEFANALQLYDKVLERNPKKSQAFWGRMLAKFEVFDVEGLLEACRGRFVRMYRNSPAKHLELFNAVDFLGNLLGADYTFAVQFAPPDDKEMYSETYDLIMKTLDAELHNTMSLVMVSDDMRSNEGITEANKKQTELHNLELQNEISVYAKKKAKQKTHRTIAMTIFVIVVVIIGIVLFTAIAAQFV